MNFGPDIGDLLFEGFEPAFGSGLFRLQDPFGRLPDRIPVSFDGDANLRHQFGPGGISLSKYRFPTGWFIVGFASELAPGQVKRAHYFGEELVIFKDSYAHAIAPFLAQHYRKVSLVDLRYVQRQWVLENVDFEGATTLFLYSTSVLNTDPRALN